MQTRLLASIYDLFKQGKYAEARAAQERVRALRDVLKLGTGPSVIKEAMNLIGHRAGPTRAPVLGLHETAKAELKEMLSRYENDR